MFLLLRGHRGSSPRVRGTCCLHRSFAACKGLIPAGAGNMWRVKLWPLRGRAHPRGCGEHGSSKFSTAPLLGSSPRVRGTFTVRCDAGQAHGLIPAGAGNMLLLSLRRRQRGAHPRGCGEHLNRRMGTGVSPGSSPRVRGTYPGTSFRACSLGLIPAGAGNMHLIEAEGEPTGAHPRGCGEHRIIPLTEHKDWGSSPRVRGTFRSVRGRVAREGLIPAGAGNMI